MIRNVVSKSWIFSFLRSEIAQILFKVFRNHLWVSWSCFLLLMLGGWHQKIAVASRESSFVLSELVIVKEGVVALSSELFLLCKVSDLATKDAVLHMSVR